MTREKTSIRHRSQEEPAALRDAYDASETVADDVVEERAKRGSREKFLAVLAKVPDAPPEPGDEL